METTVVIVTVIFYQLVPSWNAFYGVTAFKQAQISVYKKSKIENLVDCVIYTLDCNYRKNDFIFKV